MAGAWSQDSTQYTSPLTTKGGTQEGVYRWAWSTIVSLSTIV